MISKKLTNKLFDHLRSNLLDVTAFKLEKPNPLKARFTHLKTGLNFVIIGDEKYHTIYTVERQVFRNGIETIPHKGPFFSEDEVVHTFYKWASIDVPDGEYELFGPDLWNTTSSNELTFDANIPFSNSELETIKLGIEEIRTILKEEIQLNDERQKYLESRLEYLVEAAKQNSKLNWKHLVIGEIIGLGIELSLDQTKYQFLYNLFNNVLKTMLLLGPHPI